MTTYKPIDYVFLSKEFSPDSDHGRAILADITDEMRKGRYTLGPQVAEAERLWAELVGVKHAIGVNSGTDALELAMRALGVGPGWRVLTVPNTFYATIAPALMLGAKVEFVDIDDRYLMPVAETKRTDVDLIIPVHWGGDVVNAGGQDTKARKSGKGIVLEDACQAVGGRAMRGNAGALGAIAAFSAHPLKNLNALGDAGMVTTDDDELAEEVRLLRNHGLVDRDIIAMPGRNARLDTIQAIPIIHGLATLEESNDIRIANAALYDEGFARIPQVKVPPRAATPHVAPSPRHVYHLYQCLVEDRDALLKHLIDQGIGAKIHYPIPLHLQPPYFSLKRASREFFQRWNIPNSKRHYWSDAPAYDLGYSEGEFPKTELFARSHITLPVHQFLDAKDIEHVIDCIYAFYERSTQSLQS